MEYLGIVVFPQRNLKHGLKQTARVPHGSQGEFTVVVAFEAHKDFTIEEG